MSRVLIAAVLAGLMLSGCAADGEPSARPDQAPAASSKYEEYVALGDSYTAAPLVPPTDTSNICWRSGANYPALLTAAMPGTSLTDVSCSGARTEDMAAAQSGQLGSVPPQFDALAATTDLVTIGLGGNDDALFTTALGECTRLATEDPTGSPCADQTATHQAGLDATFRHIRDNLAEVVRGARERAPEARIIVIGYPQIIPGSGTCTSLPLAVEDYPFVRSITLRLTQAVQLAADDSGAEYLDLWAPSAGHDICSSEPWINGRDTVADLAAAYHPFGTEQQAVADLLLALLA